MRWSICLALSAILCGCSNRDAETLKRVGRQTLTKLGNSTGGPRGRVLSGYQAVRGSICDSTLDSRVAARLLWEKTLEDSEIEVQLVNPGTVKLLGRVREFPHRERARDVAQNTVGVTEVVNELVVAQ